MSNQPYLSVEDGNMGDLTIKDSLEEDEDMPEAAVVGFDDGE